MFVLTGHKIYPASKLTTRVTFYTKFRQLWQTLFNVIYLLLCTIPNSDFLVKTNSVFQSDVFWVTSLCASYKRDAI